MKKSGGRKSGGSRSATVLKKRRQRGEIGNYQKPRWRELVPDPQKALDEAKYYVEMYKKVFEENRGRIVASLPLADGWLAMLEEPDLKVRTEKLNELLLGKDPEVAARLGGMVSEESFQQVISLPGEIEKHDPRSIGVIFVLPLIKFGIQMLRDVHEFRRVTEASLEIFEPIRRMAIFAIKSVTHYFFGVAGTGKSYFTLKREAQAGNGVSFVELVRIDKIVLAEPWAVEFYRKLCLDKEEGVLAGLGRAISSSIGDKRPRRLKDIVVAMHLMNASEYRISTAEIAAFLDELFPEEEHDADSLRAMFKKLGIRKREFQKYMEELAARRASA